MKEVRSDIRVQKYILAKFDLNLVSIAHARAVIVVCPRLHGRTGEWANGQMHNRFLIYRPFSFIQWDYN